MTNTSDSLSPSGPQEVRPGCWMVGHRNSIALLQCNTYIRTFETPRTPLHFCLDPGSRKDFPVIEKNILQLLGNLEAIQSFTLNHQDPDVVGNALPLCAANPNVSALMTEEVWRLVQHLDFKPKRIHLVNAARSEWLTIDGEHRWQLVPTPFCHFRGAMAFYDSELRTLFSGDLFGGLNQPGQVHVWARREDWAGIAQFHQIYMPTREALRYAVRQIRALKPAVEVIAPQHGHLIAGDLVPLFLEWLYDLPVGLDLLSLELDQTHLDGYRQVLAQVMECANEKLGRDEVMCRLLYSDVADGLETMITIQHNDLMTMELNREGYSALAKIYARLTLGEEVEFLNALRSLILNTCFDLRLPIPPVEVGLVEGQKAGSIGPDALNLRPRS